MTPLVPQNNEHEMPGSTESKVKVGVDRTDVHKKSPNPRSMMSKDNDIQRSILDKPLTLNPTSSGTVKDYSIISEMKQPLLDVPVAWSLPSPLASSKLETRQEVGKIHPQKLRAYQTSAGDVQLPRWTSGNDEMLTESYPRCCRGKSIKRSPLQKNVKHSHDCCKSATSPSSLSKCAPVFRGEEVEEDTNWPKPCHISNCLLH